MSDFKQWRERMALSLRQAAEALGVNKQSIINYEAGRDPPAYIGLACSAFAKGLGPFEATGKAADAARKAAANRVKEAAEARRAKAIEEGERKARKASKADKPAA